MFNKYKTNLSGADVGQRSHVLGQYFCARLWSEEAQISGREEHTGESTHLGDREIGRVRTRGG